MAGREPREPKDWGGASGDDAPEVTRSEQSGSGSPIGGPAGEH